MLTKLLAKLEPVRRAQTAEEREAVYRFRYAIYAEEFGRELGAPDHERKMVTDPDDEKGYSTILYTGSVDNVTSTVRLRHWRPGEVPEYDRKQMSMDLLPGLDQRRVAEIGRLMIRRNMRGQLLLASLARETYDLLAGEQGSELVFAYCSPGLVRFYRKLGARPFGGRLVHTPDGVMVPLVAVISDHAYYKRMGSPLAPMVRRHFGPNKRPPIDLAPYQHLFEDDVAGIELDAERIWDEVETSLLEESSTAASYFLDTLSPEVVKELSRQGFIMDVEADTLVTRKGFGEQEMYLVLDGLFEATDGERRLSVIGKGELFGEVAFFHKSGKRVATVRSLADGRVLVLRAKSLRQMIDKEPRIAAQLLLELGSVMADRLASSASVGAIDGEV